MPEYWSGLPVPFSGDLPNPGTEHRSPALQADSSPSVVVCVCVCVCVCRGDKKGLKREVRLRSRSEEATHLAREFASYQDNKAISQAFKQENDKT